MKRLALSIALCSALFVAGTGPASAHHARHAQVRHAVKVAIRHIGDPYIYGAAGPHSFDCSGLTSFAYGRAGVSIPHESSAQYASVRHIPKSHIRRGDLMFFHHGSDVYHVAMFLHRDHGQPVLLHSPYPGKHVSREHVWTHSWWAGTLRPRHG